MLDLVSVRKQMDALVESSAGFQGELARKLDVAASELRKSSESLAEWIRKTHESKTSWLVAKFSQRPNNTYAPHGTPKRLSVLCVDGSQIPPDRHQVAPCYVINVGRVAIHYGAENAPQMDSRPVIFFKEDDLYTTVNGNRVPVEGSLLSDKRTTMEWESLRGLIKENIEAFSDASGHSSIAVVDGSLVRWSLEARRGLDQYGSKMLRPTLETFDLAKEAGVPVVGYISAPGSSDVVNALKVSLCPFAKADCDKCNLVKSERRCEKVEGLCDRMLFRRILEPGQRSESFESASEILKYYGGHRIHFFYLRLTMGDEIARVEFPQWVAESEEMTDLVHSAILDQTEKGVGYPVCLTEAHEKAIIRSKDRDMFYRLLSNLYVRRGMPAIVSRKNISKRTPRV